MRSFWDVNVDNWNKQVEQTCNRFPNGIPFKEDEITYKEIVEGLTCGVKWTPTENRLKYYLYRKGDLHLYYCLVDKKTNKVRSIISQNYNGELNNFSHTGLELDVSSLDIDSIDFDGLCNEMIIQEKYLESDCFEKTKYRSHSKFPSIPHKYKKIEVGGRLYKDLVPDNFPYQYGGYDNTVIGSQQIGWRNHDDFLYPSDLQIEMFKEHKISPLDYCNLDRHVISSIGLYYRDIKFKDSLCVSGKWSMTERLSRYMDFEIPYYGFGFWVSSNEIFNNKICYLGFPFQERLGRTPKEYGLFIPTFNVELFWKYVPEQINPKNKEIVSLTNK